MITLVLFGLVNWYKGEASFDAETAFTSIAILSMVTHPANMVMTMVPRVIASLGNFGRIQNYLLAFSREDNRLLVDQYSRGLDTESSPGNNEVVRTPALAGLDTDIVVSHATIQYPKALHPILSDIDFKADKGTITMCCGAVGTGKTTLAMTILGEIAPSVGSVSVSTRRIALCAQAPFLPSSTIKEIICGSYWSGDTEWYNRVIHACSLSTDFATLPLGDKTNVGSRGLNLSGGQRQRVVRSKFDC